MGNSIKDRLVQYFSPYKPQSVAEAAEKFMSNIFGQRPDLMGGGAGGGFTPASAVSTGGVAPQSPNSPFTPTPMVSLPSTGPGSGPQGGNRVITDNMLDGNGNLLPQYTGPQNKGPYVSPGVGSQAGSFQNYQPGIGTEYILDQQLGLIKNPQWRSQINTPTNYHGDFTIK